MRIFEGISEAADAVRHNKLRTFLSLLGMIIGTGSVVAVIAAGAMMSHEFIDQADAIGARLIVVYSNWEIADYQTRQVYMSNRDIEAMRNLDRDSLFVRVRGDRRQAVRGAVSRSVRLQAADPGYWALWPRTFISGRAILQSDEDSLAKVCVITEDYASAFFPDGNALGSSLTIGAFDYLVVGVVSIPTEQSLMSDGTNRETVFLPYSAIERTTDWTWSGLPGYSSSWSEPPLWLRFTPPRVR
jgi:putative ABC transport system permease protein